jgi:hypothetical protein
MTQNERKQSGHIFELAGGEVRAWIEQDAIHIRAAAKGFNDPAELTASEARRLSLALKEMADIIET